MQPVETPAAPVVHSFRFTGATAEYFRVWIVNTALTIATLGMYSAWAKVRKRRWLYGHTWVAGSNFDYHASPRAILRGRVLALAAFGAYSSFGLLSRTAAVGLLAGVAVLAPWLVLRALAFGAANSSFRNIPFRFRGRYRDAARAIGPLVVWPLLVFVLPDIPRDDADMSAATWAFLLAPVALYLPMHPYMMGWRWRLRLNGTSFGTVPCTCDLRLSRIYRVYLGAALLAPIVFVAAGIIVMAGASLGSSSIGLLYLAAVPLAGVLPLAYVRARTTNAALDATRVGDRIRILSNLSAGELAWLYAVNAVAVVCSFGLLVPWAVVRTARYRASALALETEGDLDGLLAGVAARDAGAGGEELSELFGFDFSL